MNDFFLFQTPTSPQEWLQISKDFFNLWNFPHCLGAVDGKHVVLQTPIQSGSEYFNYKSHFSIVLMAIVDANYKFLYADVGCQGRISDGGVFKNTTFYHNLQAKALNLPEETHLMGNNTKSPYVFLADDAFPLMKNIMKPYPGSWMKKTKERAFNYRLSRARRIVENVFGILSSVFRVLRKPMLLEPEKATDVVLACVYLHNFLRNSRDSAKIYTPNLIFDEDHDGQMATGAWRSDSHDLTSLLPIRNIPRRSADDIKKIRDVFAEYCMVERVPWQDDYE